MNLEAAPRQHRVIGGAQRAGAVRVVPVAGGTRPHDVTRLFAALRRRLGPESGDDVALLPHPPGDTGAHALREARLEPLLHTAAGLDPGSEAPTEAGAAPLSPVPKGTAVLLRTSGSTTGQGHLVALSADALLASARATEQHLSGPGTWVLALPAHHVAGLQVLVRSVLAGTDPVIVDTSTGFEPRALVDAISTLTATPDDQPLYTSLVPTQLVRALDAGDVAPLRRFSAILVGGASTDPRTLQRAHEAGLTVVTTYGMTETGGGCVYDGVPLPAVELSLEPDTERVLISGPTLASGYVDDAAADAATFITDGDRRWLRTSDHGHLSRDGAGQRLRVLGRVDDVINTGGVKVSPARIEAVLTDAVADVLVVGVPDDEWGQLVTAVVATHGRVGVGPDANLPTLAELRQLVGQQLDGAHAPRALVTVDELPLRGPGKVDRRAAATLAAERLAQPDRTGVEQY